MSSVIQDIESSQLRGDLPDFAPGDRVKVHFLVIEGNRKRPQVFEGVVIKRQGSGSRETFTVRKQSFGVGVERTFPVHSPKIEKLEVASRGAVRRAKLYYLRGRTGKAARVAERRWGIDEEVIGAGEVGAVDASGEGLAPEEAAPEAPDQEEAASAEAEGQAEVTDTENVEHDPGSEAEAGGEGAGDTENPAEASGADQPDQPEAETDQAPGAEAESGEDAGEESDGAEGEKSAQDDAEPAGDRDEA